MKSTQQNVAHFLGLRARTTPDALGLVWPDGRNWKRASWRELFERANGIACGFERLGVARGDRALVLAPPDRDWLAAIQALWTIGAVPVLIDPGMERDAFLAACKRIKPRILIGSPKAQLAKVLYSSSFDSIELSIAHGTKLLPSAKSLAALADSSGDAELAEVELDDQAAILFTSGATGAPKGASYSHANFLAQVVALRELYDIREGEADLACFPLFALFNAALGIASILPPIDFARPAECDPAEIVRALDEQRCAQSFGSPAIWARVVAHCEANSIALSHLKRLMIAGAPVSPRLVARAKKLLSNGEVHTPYGATECLPVSNASGAELERVRAKADGCSGAYLGRLAPNLELAIVKISDKPIATWSAELEVARGEIGELCVRSPRATSRYEFEPEATALAKIQDPRGGFWHRMGDLGRVDSDGELWLVGRKSQRIESAKGLVCPVPIENVLDQHEYVRRSAVVGVGARGSERPIAVVECKRGKLPRDAKSRERLALDILRVGMWFPCCTALEAVLFHPSLPVDRRHNAKIDRTALKRWAEERLR